ncbi:MAG: DNA methyltransferase [Chloroherpetonaceae bacterium]|nr:site-specific DNA-methyltransferase [Chloroherpetonaceae bacterium]MDW8018469.1 DNA methyltransferase [Chloroherpetonaceae bacterium]
MRPVLYVEGEFWTSKQRQTFPLHYILSYRASFKAELPDFFIRQFSKQGEIVLDPFGGRGTTALQANLCRRIAFHNDINPISEKITYAKTHPVSLADIERRLRTFDLSCPVTLDEHLDLLVFYHPDTLKELLNLRREIQQHYDDVNRFIELIAVSRLHGHSDGFFSVYSFPQIAVSPDAQRKINEKRRQTPPYREVKSRILRKAELSLQGAARFQERFPESLLNRIHTGDSRQMPWIESETVDLVVTSPPFLDKVDYLKDNWLKAWFYGIEASAFKESLVQTRNLEEWKVFIRDTLRELYRVVKPNGVVVVEVGEVVYKQRVLNLDEIVAELGEDVGFSIYAVLVNKQRFTKLANCFGVSNNEKGTNTNRCVVLVKGCLSHKAFPQIPKTLSLFEDESKLYSSQYSKELFTITV